MSKRRKQGEGTLRKRADGRWEARIVIGYDEKGNPITKNVTAMEKVFGENACYILSVRSHGGCEI